MFLALKEMKKDKGRFLLIISIVVLISYLVFFLTALALGLATDNRTAVDLWDANRVVLKSGTNANILSSMFDVELIEEFDGHDISPINIGRSVAYINGREDDANTIDLVLIGMHQDSKAYPDVIEGELPTMDDEILASITLKNEDNVEIGDTIVLSMNDRQFTVTGFTNEAKYNISSVIYTDLQMASAAMMSSIMTPEQEEVETDEDEKPGPIDGGLEKEPEGDVETDGDSGATEGVPERVSGVLIHDDKSLDHLSDEFEVVEMDDFIMKLPGYLAQVLTFGLMIIFLVIISTIVLGVFMFIITMQKRQTFGIMKIQGISNAYIAKSVIFQTFLVSSFGVLIALGLTYASEFFLPYTVPFKSNIVFYAIIGISIIIISLLGAIFSVRGVSKVDPLEVLE